MKMQESNYSTTASRREAARESVRYLHTSCKAYMVPNPESTQLPMIPYTQRPGITYNVGRNKAKREAIARLKISEE
jgi:hypothetical protein